GRVVLAAVDLDVHVRPDLPVEAADAGHVGLRLPGDARVAAPQSREGLTMRLVATLDEFAPRLRVLRCPHKDRVHAMLRPAKAMQAGAAAGDGDIAALGVEDVDECIVDAHPPPRSVAELGD